MRFNLQPTLQNDLIRAEPLKAADFEILYAVASDPLIWEQHPNKDRYKREVFETFFQGAMESGGAFLVYDNKSNQPIGSSRFYEFDAEKNSVAIGFTFFARDHWGGNYNRALKTLMLDHAFQFVDNVILYVGVNNIRSQKAVEKLGAIKLAEQEIKYYGELPVSNFVYLVTNTSSPSTQTYPSP